MKSTRPQFGGRNTLQAAALAALWLLPLTGIAQDYPSRPITIVVGFPAGSATDNLVRPLANSLQGALGQLVIIDNKPGANGVVAVVKRASQM